MTYADIIELAGKYAAFCATVFSVAYGPAALWRLFRDLSNPRDSSRE